jgi:homoaconitate hydratase
LKYKGIQLIIAGSFSQTYARNAINNGFIVLKCPELTKKLKNIFGEGNLSLRTEIKATVDFELSKIITEEKKYGFPPLGTTAQELIVCGGLENWVKSKIHKEYSN